VAARTLWARPDRRKAKTRPLFARQNLPGALISCRVMVVRNLKKPFIFNLL
jgi:hypothetical protein